MKYIAPLLILACLVGRPLESRADLFVTLGGVTGVSTNLDVTIEGSGTIAVDPLYIALYRFPTNTAPLTADTHFFSEVADNDIGKFLTSTYNYYGAAPSSPITLHNLTDSTSVDIAYLNFNWDSDPLLDNFQLIFYAPDVFIEPGDEWMISGQATVPLTSGNASVFTLGTYSYTDGSIGEVTLVIQESSAIPEPFTALSFIIGGLLLLFFRKQKMA